MTTPNRKRRRLWYVVAVIGAVLLVTVFVAAGLFVASTVSLIRDTQTTNTPLLKNTERTVTILEDCLNPQGQCYQDNERRTGTAVTDLDERNRRAAAAAVACADEAGTQTQDEVFRCVMRRLGSLEQPPSGN